MIPLLVAWLAIVTAAVGFIGGVMVADRPAVASPEVILHIAAPPPPPVVIEWPIPSRPDRNPNR